MGFDVLCGVESCAAIISVSGSRLLLLLCPLGLSDPPFTNDKDDDNDNLIIFGFWFLFKLCRIDFKLLRVSHFLTNVILLTSKRLFFLLLGFYSIFSRGFYEIQKLWNIKFRGNTYSVKIASIMMTMMMKMLTLKLCVQRGQEDHS